MNFLKKIFGSLGKPDANYINRAPRIGGSAIENVLFKKSDGSEIQVQNLSTSGVGFTTYSFTRPPAIGDEISGRLDFGDKTFEVVLRVRRVNGPIAGCSIQSSVPGDLIADLSRRFDIEVAAIKLRTIDPSILKTEPIGKPQFFVGSGDGAELFLVEDNGRLMHFHGSVWGHYFESKEAGHRAFGELEEKKEKGTRSSAHASSTIIHMDPDVQADKVEIASRFLKHIPGVSDELRSQLLERVSLVEKASD